MSLDTITLALGTCFTVCPLLLAVIQLYFRSVLTQLLLQLGCYFSQACVSGVIKLFFFNKYDLATLTPGCRVNNHNSGVTVVIVNQLLTVCGSSTSYFLMEDINCRCLFCSSSATTSCSLSWRRCCAPASSSLNHWFSWHRRRTCQGNEKESGQEMRGQKMQQDKCSLYLALGGIHLSTQLLFLCL